MHVFKYATMYKVYSYMQTCKFSLTKSIHRNHLLRPSYVLIKLRVGIVNSKNK